jgi:hypothetical protein
MPPSQVETGIDSPLSAVFFKEHDVDTRLKRLAVRAPKIEFREAIQR